MAYDPSTDADTPLVLRAKAGDYSAFEGLVKRHESRLYGLALNILRNREDAEEAVQTAFVSLMSHLDGFRGEAPFHAWLTRIAANAALDILRKRHPQVGMADQPASEDSAEGLPLPVVIADWRAGPEELAERSDTRAQIDAALGELPDKYRSIFVLRDVEGLSTEEAAAALGITVTAAKIRLMRARLQLREKLTGLFGDPATRRAGGHLHG